MFTSDDFYRFQRAFEADIRRLQNEFGTMFHTWCDPRRTDQPVVNLWDTEKGAVLVAEVPGAGSDDVELSVLGDELTLIGVWPAEQPEEGRRFFVEERRPGEYRRTIKVPFEIDAEAVAATCKNGVLRVELVRKGQDQARKVDIEEA